MEQEAKFKYWIVEQDIINPDGLGQKLQAALGATIVSVDTGVKIPDRDGVHIVVKMAAHAKDADGQRVDQIIRAHEKFLIFEQGTINPDRLHEDLQAALGAKYDYISTGETFPKREGTYIKLRLADAAEADRNLVEQIIKAHDPKQLSRRQQRDQDKVDAFMRLTQADFKALRALKGDEKVDAVLNLLEDIQKLLGEPRG